MGTATWDMLFPGQWPILGIQLCGLVVGSAVAIILIPYVLLHMYDSDRMSRDRSHNDSMASGQYSHTLSLIP